RVVVVVHSTSFHSTSLPPLSWRTAGSAFAWNASDDVPSFSASCLIQLSWSPIWPTAASTEKKWTRGLKSPVPFLSDVKTEIELAPSSVLTSLVCQPVGQQILATSRPPPVN